MSSEPDLDGAVEAVERTAEDVRSSASRVAELAFSVRDALDGRSQDLVRAEHELASRRAAIEEELEHAKAEAAGAVQELRDEIAREEVRLSELQRQHAGITTELGDLGAAKELVLEQVARAQDQLGLVLPAMAQETLQTVLTAFAPGADAVPDEEDDGLSGRPIGRIMDLREDDV